MQRTRMPSVWLVRVVGAVLTFMVAKIANDAFSFVMHVFRALSALALLFIGDSPLYHQLKHLDSWAAAQSHLSTSQWLVEAFTPLSNTDKPDLVVAHFREDLRWLSDVMPHVATVHLYCKDAERCLHGVPDDAIQSQRLKVVYLPNKGRESHTYLTHIVKHYHQLPPRTVFTLASLNHNPMRWSSLKQALMREQPTQVVDRIDEESHRTIMQFQLPHKGVAYSMGDGYDDRITAQFDANYVVKTHPHPLARWLLVHTGLDMASSAKWLCTSPDRHGAIFTATSEQIRWYPLTIYASLLQQNSSADLMESGYFMERIWRYLYCKSPLSQGVLHTTAWLKYAADAGALI